MSAKNQYRKMYYQCKYADMLGRHYFDNFEITSQDFEKLFKNYIIDDLQDIKEFLDLHSQYQNENERLVYTITQQNVSNSHIYFYDSENKFVAKDDAVLCAFGKDKVVFHRKVIYYCAQEEPVRVQTNYRVDDNYGENKILSYLVVDRERFTNIYNQHKDEIRERIKQSKYDYVVRTRNLPIPANPKEALKDLGVILMGAVVLGAVVTTAVLVSEHKQLASTQSNIEPQTYITQSVDNQFER